MVLRLETRLRLTILSHQSCPLRPPWNEFLEVSREARKYEVRGLTQQVSMAVVPTINCQRQSEEATTEVVQREFPAMHMTCNTHDLPKTSNQLHMIVRSTHLSTSRFNTDYSPLWSVAEH